jgi:hypothetical protein
MLPPRFSEITLDLRPNLLGNTPLFASLMHHIGPFLASRVLDPLLQNLFIFPTQFVNLYNRPQNLSGLSGFPFSNL